MNGNGWMEEFLAEIQNNPDKYSPWSINEAAILKKLKIG